MRHMQWYTHLIGSVLGGVILAVLLAGCSLVSQGEWEQVGSTNGHIVLSLAADPYLKQLYVGTDGGIVYRTHTDRADALLPGEGLPKNSVIGALLPDSHTHGLVYAGGTHGLYVTTDYGAHWQARGAGFPPDDTIDALIAGNDQQTLIAGSQAHGVYISHDQGVTWQSSSAGLPANANIYTMLGDRASHTTYAAVDGVGVFASADGGGTWTEHTAGLPTHVFALAELPNHDQNAHGATLYAGTERGVYASSDGGQHWKLSGSLLQTVRVLSLAVDPTATGTLYAGTDTTVFRSADGGGSWKGVAAGLSTHVAALVVVPDSATHYVIFAGAGGLTRYPSTQGNSSIIAIAGNIAFLIALAGVAYYFIRRGRMRIRAMELRTRQEAAERRERAQPWRTRRSSRLGEDAADDVRDDAVRGDSPYTTQANGNDRNGDRPS